MLADLNQFWSLWWIFTLEGVQFVVLVMAALAAFAIFWLYATPWYHRRNWDEIPLLGGYLLLAFSFLIEATVLENEQLVLSITSSALPALLAAYAEPLAYLLIFIGVIIDPLPQHPRHPKTAAPAFFGLTFSVSLWSLLPFAAAAACFMVSLAYWRRATRGLERHLLPAAFAFFFLALRSASQGLALLLHDNSVVFWRAIAASYSWLWLIGQLWLTIAVLLLLIWAWHYLLKRLLEKIFITYVSSILIVLILSALLFTSLLLTTTYHEHQKRLSSDVKITLLALQSRQQSLLAGAKNAAQYPPMGEGILTNQAALHPLAEQFILNQSAASFLILNRDAQVLARGENREQTGDSLSGHTLVQRALQGEDLVAFQITPGVITPLVSLQTATPIKRGTEVIGAVFASLPIDDAFVDGLKHSSGLDLAVLAGDRLAASTLSLTDSPERWEGISLNHPAAISQVLKDGQLFTGTINLLHTPFETAIMPLTNEDGSPIGMLLVGVPQASIWQSVAISLNAAFAAAVLLIVFSLIPSYLLATHLVRQIR